MTEPNNNPPPPAPDPAPHPAPHPAFDPASTSAPSSAPPPYTGPDAQQAQPQPAAPLEYRTPGLSSGPPPYTGPAPTQDDRTMAMLAHVLGILSGFVGPLIIWIVKKDQSPFVDDQGKEALNFQLTMLIAWLISGVSTAICIGFILMPAVLVVAIAFGIIAGMAANKGEAYRYPVSIRFIK